MIKSISIFYHVDNNCKELKKICCDTKELETQNNKLWIGLGWNLFEMKKKKTH